MTEFICGPSGGLGGTEFRDDVPSGTTVGEVRISAEVPGTIRSVQFLYVNADGAVIEQPYRGIPSDDAGTAHAISLGEKAYIARITGRYGIYVDSMKITTVRDEGGDVPRSDTKEFGGPGGAANFDYQAPPGYEIVGFIGRSHDVVDAIGAVFRPLAERGISVSDILGIPLPGPVGGGQGFGGGSGPDNR